MGFPCNLCSMTADCGMEQATGEHTDVLLSFLSSDTHVTCWKPHHFYTTLGKNFLDRNFIDLWLMVSIYNVNKIWHIMAPTRIWSKFTYYSVGCPLQYARAPTEMYLACMPELSSMGKWGCSPVFCFDMKWECNQMCTKRPGLWDTLGNISTLPCG